MKEYDLESLKLKLIAVANVLIESKELLTHIDNLSGDGDLGISMEKVGNSVLREVSRIASDGIAGLLSRCAVSINVDAPSTMGTLISFSVMEAARLMKGKSIFQDEDLLRIPARMVEIIMIRGRALRGDKTVLDALIPYSETLSKAYQDEANIAKAAVIAANQAFVSANLTKGCIAKIGRAKWIAERSRNCPDGGAVVAAIITNMLVNKKIEIRVDSFI
jgi:dihydroxyacetone kinase